MKIKRFNLLLLLTLVGSLFVFEAGAATRTVDTTADDGALTACTAAASDCSLRGAISGAAAGDAVDFDAALINSTITLSGEITLVRSVTISGPGADKLTISGGGATRLFSYFSGGAPVFNFSRLTLAQGSGNGANNNNQGGAVQIGGGASATFDEVYFRDNNAAAIGGVLLLIGGAVRIVNSSFINNSSNQASCIYLITGSLQIYNSTFSGNAASGAGAIYNSGRPLTLRNVTIAGNTGGGIYPSGGSVTIGNTIVAGNTPFDLWSSLTSVTNAGGNVIGSNVNSTAAFPAGMPNVNGDRVGTGGSPLDARLSAATNFGGAMPVRVPLAGSPALQAGNNCVLLAGGCGAGDPFAALVNDQRGAGFPRLIGAAVDSGAIESLAPTAASVSISGRILTADGGGLRNASVILTDSRGAERVVRSSSFGAFLFDNVAVGETYVISVSSKNYQFAPQILSVTDELGGLNFYAVE